MTTAEKIRFARQGARLTQKQLGERAGIAEPTIRKYELGKLNPKPSTLEKIANATQLHVSFFCGTIPFDDIEFLLKVKSVVLSMLKRDHFLEENVPVDEISDYQYFKLIDKYVICVTGTSIDDVGLFLNYLAVENSNGHFRNDQIASKLDLSQLTLLDYFESLNETGKQKAIEQISELAKIPEYQDKDILRLDDLIKDL